MKLILAAAAAAFALPALAQDMPATPPAAPMQQTTPTPPATPPADPAAMPATPAPADPAAMPAQTMPAAGAVTMGPSTPMVQQLPDAPMAADGKVPMCTKAVTDHCMERSNARGERMHSTPRAH